MNVYYKHDLEGIHHESFWNKYFNDALDYLEMSQNEELAEKYLRKKRYLFISRNYWSESGEIDLVFLHRRTLIFVEVKTRRGSLFGTGREAVDYNKQRNIKNTSKEFIRAHCINNKVPFFIFKIPIYLKYTKIRYDVIEVSVDDVLEMFSRSTNIPVTQLNSTDKTTLNNILFIIISYLIFNNLFS